MLKKRVCKDCGKRIEKSGQRCEEHQRQRKNLMQNMRNDAQREIVTRSCICGCGSEFAAKNSYHKYFDESHKPVRNRSRRQAWKVCQNPECGAQIHNGLKYCNNLCGNRARHIKDSLKKGLPILEPAPAPVRLQNPNEGKLVAHIPVNADKLERERLRMDALVRASRLPGYNPRHPELSLVILVGAEQ